MLKAPILLIAFNRPATTQQVLDAIALHQPPVLYVATDGARNGNAKDAIACAAVHDMVAEWQKNNPGTVVKTLYQNNNLGCGVGVSTAITWFFNNEEMGIVLEDDCLPNPSFFTFCETLLEKYKNDNGIMHISGTSFVKPGITGNDDSYYFSIYPHVWGWASWRRAWSKYDFKMTKFNELLQLKEFTNYYDADFFLKTIEGGIDTWDYQWVYSIMLNKSLSITPAVNLISNLGFEDNPGIHINKKPKWYNPERIELHEIKHPVQSIQNTKADRYVFNIVYKRGMVYRLKKTIKKLFS